MGCWYTVELASQTTRSTSMGTTNDNPRVDGKTGAAPKIESGGSDKAAHEDDTDTRNFIETHHVTKVARKTVPGSGEESADLLQDEEVGRS
jgi:hypothetical protein